LRLAQEQTQEQVTREFGVHRNSVRERHWQESGLAGLYEGAREGRPSALSPVVAERLRQVTLQERGTVGHLMHCMEQQQLPLLVRPDKVANGLKGMGSSYKRYRES
jgi:transposase